MEVAEKRLPFAWAGAKPEEIGVQRICKIPGSAAWIERVGRSIEERPLGENEVLPGRFVAGRASAREHKILEVKRGQVTLELPRLRTSSGKRPPGARLECVRETVLRRAPPRAFPLTIKALDEPRLNQQPCTSRRTLTDVLSADAVVFVLTFVGEAKSSAL